MKKRIGILGSGIVAKSLANGFIKNDHQVMMGTRSPEKLKDFSDKVMIGTCEDTASWGEIIVLAAKGKAAEEVLKSAGSGNLMGKTIIDATNPIEDTAPENGVLKFFTDLNESLMEKLQKIYPESNFVKCFSCVGNAYFTDPDFNGEKPTMFICGNDENAKKETTEILETFGWEWEDMGKAESARAIEPLCILWCIPGFRSNEWNHAFRMLKA
ncbi:MAG: NAD(P)-binding domain-containing protein [Bacteroidetes bacterium]|nr:NAD(P)-binding domain-containing protein [Bacteroidota bacterium]